MDSVIVYAIITLWLIVMLPAIAAPLFVDRTKRGANMTPTVSTISIRQPPAAGDEGNSPTDRAAA